MTNEELKQYLRQNLEIGWKYDYPDGLRIVLSLEGEVISEMPFGTE